MLFIHDLDVVEHLGVFWGKGAYKFGLVDGLVVDSITIAEVGAEFLATFDRVGVDLVGSGKS